MHRAAPGVKMTALLFARTTDCVVLGDSDGHVTVYQLKNLIVGEEKQVKLRWLVIHFIFCVYIEEVSSMERNGY